MLFPIDSLPATQFTAALAAAGGTLTPPYTAGPVTDLAGLPPGGSGRFRVTHLSYSAVEHVGLGFDFFADHAGTVFLGRYVFASADGWQLGGSGLYRYYVDGLSIPVLDSDRTIGPYHLHVALSNVDTVAKSADDAGAVTVTIWVEPEPEVTGAFL